MIQSPGVRSQVDIAFMHGHAGTSKVRGNHFIRGTLIGYTSAIEQEYASAERLNCRHIMTHKKDRATTRGDVLHFAEALVLELLVADGEDFVDDEDFG